ncbi:MAG TPA: HEXXH motif-containing putative peptide modification protein [Candidatus Angelobacter sp.]
MPANLRAAGEHALRQSHSLTRHNYSTERFLTGIASESNVLLKALRLGDTSLLQFEASSSEVERYCAQHNLHLKKAADSIVGIDSIQVALSEIIQPCTSLFAAVAELVWRCHILDAECEDYDVSFSDPAIPFSIFVSVPARVDRRSALRVAESLVHETMHLQLTLFEVCCPLVDQLSNWSMYSPWKQQPRPAQGILHGLYVFHVLRWMWQQIVQRTRIEIDHAFAMRRIAEIDDEISSVRAFEKSPALTKEGNLFLEKLFGS